MRPGDDTTSDLVGQTIGGFRIDAALGAGGMSTVYRGTHLRLERPVALKILHGRFSEEPSFRARFLREAQVAAQLRHPTIIGIVDSGVIDGRYFIAMEYIQGRTLSELLSEGRLAVPLAVNYVRQSRPRWGP